MARLAMGLLLFSWLTGIVILSEAKEPERRFASFASLRMTIPPLPDDNPAPTGRQSRPYRTTIPPLPDDNSTPT